MPLVHIMKGLPSDNLAAEGLMYQDLYAITSCQRECMNRLANSMQIEQEAYLTQHPEVKAMLELFICKMVKSGKRKDILKEAAEFFTRPAEVLDKEIREQLKVPMEGPYIQPDKKVYKYDDLNLENELRDIIVKHYPPSPWVIPTPHVSTPDTPSSTFISIITSDTTIPTPQPSPTPEPTLSEIFFGVVSNTVDKAIYSHVDDRLLRYDTAYVELMKCVEEAMEIPVIEIKQDIAQLYYNAFKMFELDIMKKEQIAAEKAWEKRMRKKLKRTLRRLDNFKGYVTPPSPKSEISSHESYKKPPPKPCICHPQYYYNRYPKDRFGIYLPTTTDFSDHNVTATPAISMENLEDGVEDYVDTKSLSSRKSAISHKTNVNKKTATIKTE